MHMSVHVLILFTHQRERERERGARERERRGRERENKQQANKQEATQDASMQRQSSPMFAEYENTSAYAGAQVIACINRHITERVHHFVHMCQFVMWPCMHM